MAILIDIAAVVVLHLATAAYSHFGVTLEPLRVERPEPVERVVARSPRRVVNVSDRPETRVRTLRT